MVRVLHQSIRVWQKPDEPIDNQRLFLLSNRYFSQIPDVTLAFMAGYLLMLKTGCLTPDLI